MRVIGMMLSMGITMLIFAVCIGTVQITPEYYPVFLKSMQIAFWIFTVSCATGIYASLARVKVRDSGTGSE